MFAVLSESSRGSLFACASLTPLRSEDCSLSPESSDDGWGAFTLHEATINGREIDRIGNVGWWEDVLPPEDIDGHSRLAGALDTPIRAGGQYSYRFHFRGLFHVRAADVVNPGVSRMGITEMKRIATLADVHDVLFSPHQGMGSAPQGAGHSGRRLDPWRESLSFAGADG